MTEKNEEATTPEEKPEATEEVKPEATEEVFLRLLTGARFSWMKSLNWIRHYRPNF